MEKGLKFGRWTTLGESIKEKGHIKEKCICTCGTIKFVYKRHLLEGNTTSCGCFAKEQTRARNGVLNTKHGMQKTRIYHIYQNAKYRCINPHATHYELYGGRGIKFEWNSFEEFYQDMAESYYKHTKEFGERETTLERIDYNGNYSKENCTWITQKEQQQNKRSNHKLIYKGKEYGSRMMFCEEFGIKNYPRFAYRLNNGLSVEEALREEKFRPGILLSNQK